MKTRETKGDQMKRKQWVQLGLVASSTLLLTGCYQRYQRQSSPKKEAATSQTSAKKQAKSRQQTIIPVCFFRLPTDFCHIKRFGCHFQIE